MELDVAIINAMTAILTKYILAVHETDAGTMVAL